MYNKFKWVSNDIDIGCACVDADLCWCIEIGDENVQEELEWGEEKDEGYDSIECMTNLWCDIFFK